MRLIVNPFATRQAYTQEESRITSRSAAETARTEIRSWPGYASTPLRSLDWLADELNVQKFWLKDESTRLGLGSFKSLGGSYAALLKLRELGSDNRATLCCATEGNHGRSVAFAAKRFGCSAVIYMSEHALAYKADAIEQLGARVVRTAGTYDDAVRVAQKAATQNGWILISDTHAPNDETVCRVMQGYGVMVLEVLEQLPADERPTHVFLQGGVGGLAAGVAGVLSDVMGEHRPTIVVVEPETAACLFESAARFAPSKVAGDLRTQMQMLAVGEASAAAWPVLQRRVDAFMTLTDAPVLATVARLNCAQRTHDALDIGISGAASLAAAVALAGNAKAAQLLRLDTKARVLAFGTEAGQPRSAANP